MTFLMTLLGMIPGLSTLAGKVMDSFFNAKVAMYTSRWGVTRDVAVSAIQAEGVANQAKVSWLQVVAASPVLAFIVIGFAAPWIIYEWKVVAWDNVLSPALLGHAGFTPEIKGMVADWSNIILGGIFISSTGAGIAHAIISKKD